MVQDNELLWNGHLRTVNIGDNARKYELGILQPWDEYINASTVAWAGTFWDELLPNILESFQIDGKLYGFPWDGEVYTRVYNKMIWDTIGETPAETIDEFELQLEEIVKANPDKDAMCLRHNGGTLDGHMYMQMWLDDGVSPWISDENGSYLNVKSDEYKMYLDMLKRWYDKGILTDESWGSTMYDSWNTGNTATGQSGAAWLQATAQKVFGRTNIIAMPNPVANAGDTPKTLFFNNGAMLFKGAAEPQEITDWLLWMVDPTVEKLANYSFIRGHLNYYHTPNYQSIFDNFLPDNADWGWMYEILEMIKASEAIPSDSWTDVIGPIINVWEEKYVHGEIASIDEAVDGMHEEFMDAVSKAVSA
jgi:ABC-type glycerol-3-phosphate transport system substrate-binding protein